MRAVVLVGGFGTRLRPLTLTIPKPMLLVGHRPIVENVIGVLAAAGIEEVVLGLGFIVSLIVNFVHFIDLLGL